MQLALENRKKVSIRNDYDETPLTLREQKEAEDLRKKWGVPALHRPTKACNTYNCHGFTFASRRTNILIPAEIEAILRDDGYKKINLQSVTAGDIVIYRDSTTQEITHSGVVIEVIKEMLGTVPKVIGKWGNAHEVVHPYNHCPYIDRATVEWYRLEQ